jgi:hypothetical protein
MSSTDGGMGQPTEPLSEDAKGKVNLLRILVVGLALAVLVLAAVRFYIWFAYGLPPRPADVPADAVFDRAPGDLPGERTGSWIYCWYDRRENVDVCRLTNPSETLQYQGAFLPYEGAVVVSDGDLEIDGGALNRQNWFDTSVDVGGDTYIPIIPLKNGQTLLPRDAFAKAKKQLDALRARRMKE